MAKQIIGTTDVEASRIALGCMRMAALDLSQAEETIRTALDEGISFIDHADIYGNGESEIRFAQAAKNLGLSRDDYLLQSKCGIRKGFFDFSKDHIMASVDGILKRLETDYLDFLVLHRPDILMEPEEVAEAFTELEKVGKVRYFGVSNQNRYQMELLQAYMDQKLVVNQMQLSPAHTPMFDSALNVNMRNQAGIDRDNGLVDYCRLNKVTIQAWSPFQIDLDKGLFTGNPDYQELNETIANLADQYRVSAEAIIIAWILRHPAQMQAIVGSMNPDRLRKIAQANSITLSRADWYDIYRSAGNSLP
ncbi:aldo/keto reductase [Streptococcus pseudoporcinus]|uniref:Oxidoreductase, aldo/keto reductase family protein n=1 Tax=Streptococcus pseudoporcinus LQ 940-04 TaxID=875093 RepID=G5K7W3_9STRE|nr:aldo/keto reductase [Streptococcus pseudoporcinus]EFR45079.1 oxidoreductase, aldo/keto reductase family protein [Streptococcus pseudoporcinus SPIN 20026]EHI65663.1 oxidoreductase, aldo/keto reductase family protein [Streptococcus pseudoporcinus LQ 940-04]VEF94141.1 aldo/keto reductase [Streptococcus pseudoporcinus]